MKMPQLLAPSFSAALVNGGIVAGLSLMLLGSCSQVPEVAEPSEEPVSAVAAPTVTKEAGTTTPAPEPNATESGAPLVGISMPAIGLERWKRDGEKMKAELEAMGYQVDLLFADNKPEVQYSQVEDQINAGAEVLVITAIDPEVLLGVLQQATDLGIAVVAYDRLPMSTENIDYYVTWDFLAFGRLQGEYLRDTLGLDAPDASFTFESFAGSDDDGNARFYTESALEILGPYLDEGQLVCLSEKCSSEIRYWTDIAVHGWDSEVAQMEMMERLAGFYQTEKIEAILSPNDSVALGIAAALEDAGYQPGVDWPLLTGMDADEENVKLILAGKQSMTTFKDTAILASYAAVMVDQILKGEEVVTNTSFYNYFQDVPTLAVEPAVVTKDKIQEILVDTGFYTAEQLGL